MTIEMSMTNHVMGEIVKHASAITFFQKSGAGTVSIETSKDFYDGVLQLGSAVYFKFIMGLNSPVGMSNVVFINADNIARFDLVPRARPSPGIQAASPAPAPAAVSVQE